jgi:hypothetical protein
LWVYNCGPGPKRWMHRYKVSFLPLLLTVSPSEYQYRTLIYVQVTAMGNSTLPTICEEFGGRIYTQKCKKRYLVWYYSVLIRL